MWDYAKMMKKFWVLQKQRTLSFHRENFLLRCKLVLFKFSAFRKFFQMEIIRVTEKNIFYSTHLIIHSGVSEKQQGFIQHLKCVSLYFYFISSRWQCSRRGCGPSQWLLVQLTIFPIHYILRHLRLWCRRVT
jgi:hypothetical protein